MVGSTENLARKILTRLEINPDIQIKKPIRGLPGITSLSLVCALISTSSVQEAAEYLGYSDNPIKQSIRVLFKNNTDSTAFASGAHNHWRITLLSVIGVKYCPACRIVKPFDHFGSDPRTRNKTTSKCKSCLLIKSKTEKSYIALRTPSWADTSSIEDFYKRCPDLCHVDHIIPLRGKLVSGLHVVDNLQYLPAKENILKGNSYYIS